MPTDYARRATARVLSLLAIAAGAVIVVVLLVTAGGASYEVKVDLQDAGQLVKGNQVKVGGRPVGKISDIRLGPRNQAELVLGISDGSLTPLHRGTKAIVRSTSLSGVANRYVALVPGPNNYARIPSGGVIGADDTTPAVDLDEVLNTLDGEARSSLRAAVNGLSGVFSGQEGRANAALHALNPALSQVSATSREVLADQPALERFIVESAAVVSAVGSRDTDLEQGIANAAVATDAVAREGASLDSTLRGAPAVLRKANTTLVNVRATLREARPALREARPVAPRLAAVLTELDPVARRARPVVGQVSALLPDLAAALRRLPGLDRSARPAVVAATAALRGALPIVSGARPYVPDVVAGLLNGFGGVTGGYYDANGHYARISFEGGPYSLNQAGSLIPVPPSEGSLTGYRKGIVARCPGAATQSAPDRSNPYVVPEAPCDPRDSP